MVTEKNPGASGVRISSYSNWGAVASVREGTNIARLSIKFFIAIFLTGKVAIVNSRESSWSDFGLLL